MSQFSEKLKYLIGNSGVTIYQLSKNAGLDRTTIQRSISGERLPGISFVEKLCDDLRISPIERDDLIMHYSICKIGEKVYAGRKYIEGIIGQIAGLHVYRNGSSAAKKTVAATADIEQKTKVLVGQYGVNKLIRDVLEDEVYNSASPCISISVPFSFIYLFDCLKQLYWESDGKLSIHHVVKFSKNPRVEQNSNVNLEILSDTLPFALCMGNGYQPHYYYVASNDTENFIHPMPFYFYTEKRLVTISSDFKSAVVYNDNDILQVYQKHFQSCFVRSLPLVQQLSGPLDMLMFGFGEVLNTQQITHVIEPQPCFAKYYTHDMAEKYIRPDFPDRENVKIYVCNLYDRYKNFEHPMKSLFTVSGLRSMVETGVMADLPQSIVFPFTIEDRIHLLKLIRTDIQNDVYFSRVIDTSKLQVSHMTTTQIYNNKSVLFMAITDQGIVACLIHEQSICDAFFDFFESLPESKLLYSKEDTIKVIDEFIAQLESEE